MKISLRLPRKTIVFHIGFTSIPNKKVFEEDIKAYFNSKYPNMNFNNEDDFAFDYTNNRKIPKVFVDKLIHRMQSSTIFSQNLFKDLKVIAQNYGYESVQFPFNYK